ncbi:MAG: penicillin acylase family protein [Thermoanaerobaculia bacterium]
MFVRKLLARSAWTLLVLALVAVAAFWWLQSRGRPQRSGESVLSGLASPVEVRWDRWGMPYLRAGSSLDGARALGWLHANDRMFQMELSRRAAAGRLSEIFGERALEFDKKVRRLRIHRSAEKLVLGASNESRATLAAYAEGVNAWLATRHGDLPPELRLLRVKPEPWTPADSMGIVFLMARQLSAIFEPNEEELFVLLRAFGEERARELAGDEDATIDEEVVRSARESRAAGEDPEARPEGAGLGSNSWAVAPSRSADRSALVANDPHLGLGVPGVWYQAAIRSPDYDVSGMTIPGVPGVVLGRSENLAWAFTNLYVDDVDLYVERVDATNTKVRRGEEWVPIRSETESIRLDDGESVAVELRETDRGPLLEADPVKGLPPRSVAWTGYLPADQLAAFLALARARSVADVPQAIASYVFPAQNLVVSDREGHLLWTPIGSAPDRYGWDGRFAAPGENPAYGWAGLRPAAENPTLFDPEAGLLATANSFLPVAQPDWFQGEFDTPYRADRIRERLAERSDWSPATLVALESDHVSLWAKWLVGQLAGVHSGDAAAAWNGLGGWDFEMAASGPSALFALVERELRRAIFEDEARRAKVARFDDRWRLMHLFEGRMDPAWFDDVTTPAVEGRQEIVERALGAAWKAGVARWGNDLSAWNYGAIHTLTLDHPLGSAPLLGRWLNRGPFPLPGSATTILAFGGPWVGEAIDISYGPSMRLVNDLAEPDRALSILPSGQSGHPSDPHYDDQLPLYLRGEAREVPWTDAAIEAATVERLRLSPVKDR